MSRAFYIHPSACMYAGVLDPDFDLMFGGRFPADPTFQEEPYRGNIGGSVNGPVVRNTQVYDRPAIGRVSPWPEIRRQ